MTCVALENTASISTNSIGSVGNAGLMTLLTKKCFCLATGVTAVHLVNNSFLGFSRFMVMDCGSALACGVDFLSQLNHHHGAVAAPTVSQAGQWVKSKSSKCMPHNRFAPGVFAMLRVLPVHPKPGGNFPAKPMSKAGYWIHFSFVINRQAF
jgi:hypothetical protein